MCLLLETIRFENGEFVNLNYHQARFAAARKKFYPQSPVIQLGEQLRVPVNLGNGLYRCRVLYGETIQQVAFIPQQQRSFRSLQVLQTNLDYPHKFADRTKLNELLAQRGNADEVLLVKAGLVTDCSIGNLVFQQSGKLYTPKETLLAGTQRQRLLDEGLLIERSIPLSALHRYEAVGIINALIGLEEVSWMDIPLKIQ
ncbi:MAG: aminotransferase class IV family protein [Mangrovibacterium sp.]